MISTAQFELRHSVTLVGGLAIPLRSFSVIPGHASSGGIRPPEVELGIRITLHCRLAKPFHCFSKILGHAITVVVCSSDVVTTGEIDVRLAPGTYVLAFNNRFSLVTNKTVFAEIKAIYEKKQ